MPDPIRKTSLSHGFALAWPIPCARQEEVRERDCLLIAGAEVGQNPSSKEIQALGPNPTPAPLPRIFPFPTQVLHITRTALPHHHSPPRPARPRALQLTAFQQCSLCHACQSSANIRLRGGSGNRPLGGPLAPNHFRHTFCLLPACCPVQTWLSWCSAHFRQSPAKVIACEAR